MDVQETSATFVSSSISRLHHDILAIIFHFFSNSYELDGDSEDAEYEYKMAHVQHRPPWTLGKVCRAWRSSALSLPHLWTNFDLDLDSNLSFEHPIYRGDMQMLVVQLERCDGQPIHARLGDLPDEFDTSVAYQILSTVLSASTRVASLSLRVDSCMFDCLENDFMARPFPDLQEINLDNDGESSLGINVSDRLGPFAFRIAPRLRSFNVWGHNNLKRLEVPWAQITRYTSRDSKEFYAENRLHYEILSRLGNLQTCWLDCVVLHNDDPGVLNPPIILPYLHTLVLSCAAPVRDGPYATPGFMQLFDSITLPALRVLKFSNSTRESSQSLDRFIRRSGCSLRVLTIYEIAFHDEHDVFSLLMSGSFRALEFLSLGLGSDYYKQKASVLSALTRDSTQEDHFPQLRVFETNCWDAYQEQLADVVRSRCNSDDCGQVLERLVLREEGANRSSSTTDFFQKLCDGGLVVEWKARRFQGI